MRTKLKKIVISFYDFSIKLIFLIGLITILAFIKLQINGDVTINPDIFKSTKEIQEVNRNLQDFETIQNQKNINLGEK